MESISQGGDDDKAEIVLFSGGAPAYGRQGLDPKIVLLAAGEGADGLPRRVRIAAQLFRSGSWIAIDATTSSFRLLFGEEIEFGVATDASDGGNPLGQVLEEIPVCVSPVDGANQLTILFSFRIHLIAQPMQTLAGQAGQGGLSASLAIIPPIDFRRVLARFFWDGSVLKIDGDHPRPTLFVGPSHGHLEEPLSQDEVDPESRPHRIARILDAWGFLAGLLETCVVQSDDSGSIGREMTHDFLSTPREQGVDIHSSFRIQPIIGGPVLKRSPGSGDMLGQRVTPQAGDRRQDVLADTIPGLATSGEWQGAVEGISNQGDQGVSRFFFL